MSKPNNVGSAEIKNKNAFLFKDHKTFFSLMEKSHGFKIFFTCNSTWYLLNHV